MRSLTSVAILAGPLVLAGYGLGSLVGARSRTSDRSDAADWLLEVFVAVAVSTAAWYLIKAVSPGSTFSRVALASNQVLIVWQSVALWAGLGVVTGQVAPVTRRFRGIDGVPAALALLVVYVPVLAVAAVFAFAVAVVAAGRPRLASGVAIASLVPLAWLAWVLEAPPAWGVAPGPEVAIWACGLAGVLFSRWWIDSEAEPVQ